VKVDIYYQPPASETANSLQACSKGDAIKVCMIWYEFRESYAGFPGGLTVAACATLGTGLAAARGFSRPSPLHPPLLQQAATPPLHIPSDSYPVRAPLPAARGPILFFRKIILVCKCHLNRLTTPIRISGFGRADRSW
jgi:hypothetical protein